MISVIVPVYNTERYLRLCINSLLRQTYQDIEIILINDGSTDSSGSICDEYAALDQRIRVFHKQNGGVSSARNCGIEAARGEYIAFVDSDDYVEPGMLSAMYHKITEEDVDLVICGYTKVLDTCSIFHYCDDSYLSGGADICRFILHCRSWCLFASIWNKLYRRDLIRKLFHQNISLGEDMIFNLDYLENCQTVSCIPQCYYYYRQNQNNSLTRNQYQDDFFAICVYKYERLYQFCKKYNADNRWDDRMIHKRFLEYTIIYLSRLVSVENISITDKLKKLNEVCHNRQLQEAITLTSGLTRRYRLLVVLIRCRLSLPLLAIIEAWYLFKKIKGRWNKSGHKNQRDSRYIQDRKAS